jgi:hypothetical protein
MHSEVSANRSAGIARLRGVTVGHELSQVSGTEWYE